MSAGASREALITRARGLGTRRAPTGGGRPAEVEALLRERQAHELELLARWGGDAVAPLELDEDRRTLRALARGIAASASATRKAAGAVATTSLPRALLGRLVEAASFASVRDLLAEPRTSHPLAEAFAADDLFDVERGLARRYVDAVHRRAPRDPAWRAYLAQMVDAENVLAALALSTRGQGLDPAELFLPHGERVDLRTFTAAVASAATARELLSRALARTPLAAALFAAEPSALEDAALAWQLATAARLRRLAPLSLAPVVYLALQRRDEARRARATAWSAALGGAP